MTTGSYSIGFSLADDYAMRATIRLQEADRGSPQPATYKSVTLSPKAASIAPPMKQQPQSSEDFLAAAFASATTPAENATTTGLKSGTHLRTTRGVAAVDYLTAGDEVLTVGGATRRIARVERRFAASDGRGSLTIRVARGALANQIPSQDLWLAPQQILLANGVLVTAAELVNGVSVVQVHAIEPAVCFHIILDEPDIVLAEETPVDSFSSTPRELASAAERELARRQIAERAGVDALPEPAPGRLRGFLEDCSATRIAGWAQDMLHETSPVRVAIMVGVEILAEIPADRWRKDLEAAKIGNGHHAFEYRPCPPLQRDQLSQVKIVRIADGAELKPLQGLHIPKSSPPAAE